MGKLISVSFFVQHSYFMLELKLSVFNCPNSKRLFSKELFLVSLFSYYLEISEKVAFQWFRVEDIQ